MSSSQVNQRINIVEFFSPYSQEFQEAEKIFHDDLSKSPWHWKQAVVVIASIVGGLFLIVGAFPLFRWTVAWLKSETKEVENKTRKIAKQANITPQPLVTKKKETVKPDTQGKIPPRNATKPPATNNPKTPKATDPLSPEEQAEQTAQQTLVTDWIAKFKDDYITCSISSKNFESVVESKAIVPREEALRKKSNILGNMGLLEFSPEQIAKIDELNLTKEESKVLSHLESFFSDKAFSNGQTYLGKCSKEVEDHIGDISQFNKGEYLNYLDRANEHLYQYSTLLTPQEEATLNSKETIDIHNTNEIEIIKKIKFRLELIKLRKSQLKFLKRKKETGIILNAPIDVECEYNEDKTITRMLTPRPITSTKGSYLKHHDFSSRTDYHNPKKLEYFATLYPESKVDSWEKKKKWDKYYSHSAVPHIAYDQAKGSPVYSFLAKKYPKWDKLESSHAPLTRKVYCLRDSQFNFKMGPNSSALTLNPQVPVKSKGFKLDERWTEIVLLRGNAKDISHKDQGFFLLPPWMNEGKFFTLPLVQDDTILLGKKSVLEPFTEDLKAMGVRFVYIENLNDVQKKQFFEETT